MDSDIRQAQTQIERMAMKVSSMQRDLNSVVDQLRGKSNQIVVVPTGIEGWGDQVSVIGALIGQVELKNSGIDHQWKTTESDETTEGVFKVDVKGGWVSTQGSFNTGGKPGRVVNDVVGLGAGAGNILLKITRESSSRAIIVAEIKFEETVPVSDYYSQYVPLASIYLDEDGDLQILQLRVDPISVFEDMAIVDGEFKLVPLEMAGMNHYSPST